MAGGDAHRRMPATGGVWVSRPRWSLGRVGAIAAIALAVASAVWGYTGILGERSANTHGLRLDASDQALAAATASQTHLGEAIRVAYVDDNLAAPESEEIFANLLSLADAALFTLDQRAGELEDLVPESGAADLTATYLASARTVVASLEAGDLPAAEAVQRRSVLASYGDLTDRLLEIRTVEAAAFAGATSTQILSIIARFLVALVIPLLALAGLYDMMRRRGLHRRLELDLEAQMEMNRVKDEFIANVSHELRTPLTIIQGFATLIDDEHAGGPVGEAANFIVNEAEELGRMVDDLLTAARSDAEALAVQIDMVPFLQVVEAVVPAVNRTGAPVTTDCEAATVIADPLRLRQVLRNLLSNARKHGGPTIWLEGRIKGRHYEFTVGDDGDGPAPGLEEEMFERFVHNGSTLLTGSVGLGLAIVRHLVEEMNGTIRYYRADEHTHFTVRLPLSPVARRSLYEAADLPTGHRVVEVS